jgi:hypothetical protein
MAVESLGTQVESSGIEPISKTGSTSDSTSFDDMEEVLEAPKPQRKALDNSDSKSKKEAAGKDKPSKKAEEKEDSDEEESNEDDDGTEEDSDKSKSKGKEKSKEDRDQEGDKESKLSKPKTLKAKKGDQSFDLPSDATFEVLVDGQKQTVSAQELLNEFSGKTNWGKKFQELDSERKAFQTNQTEVQSGIDTWVELTKTDPVAAVEYACEISGLDSRQMIQAIRAQFKQGYEEYAQLTPEERKERELLDERDYYKGKNDKVEADRVRQRESENLDKRVKATMQKSGLDNATYVSTYEELKILQAKGAFTGELTPEMVGEYHQQIGKQDAVSKILTEISTNPEDKKSASSLLNDLWSKDPSLTSEDIKKIAVEVYGSDAARKLSKKVKRSDLSTPAISKARTTINDPMFFDDLD